MNEKSKCYILVFDTTSVIYARILSFYFFRYCMLLPDFSMAAIPKIYGPFSLQKIQKDVFDFPIHAHIEKDFTCLWQKQRVYHL